MADDSDEARSDTVDLLERVRTLNNVQLLLSLSVPLFATESSSIFVLIFIALSSACWIYIEANAETAIDTLQFAHLREQSELLD